MNSAQQTDRVLSVRERIKAIQVNLREADLTPSLAREAVVILTGLLGNCHDEQRTAEHAYKLVLLDCLSDEKRANRARIVAETTPAYARAREAKDTTELVKQMIVTCRAYLRSLDEEIRLAR